MYWKGENMDYKIIYEQLQKEALDRYQTRFYKEGETPKALGWGELNDQLVRFKTICDNIELKNKSILDIGCGFADFCGFLLDRGIECNYIGVDIIPEFIQCCKNKYKNATFINTNIMLEDVKIPKADIVVTTGTLNLKLKLISNLEYTKNFMKKAFSKAEECLVLDFLSTHLVDSYPREDFVFYHDPKDVLDMAFDLTNDIKLVHNYQAIPQKEFTLIMYKR